MSDQGRARPLPDWGKHAVVGALAAATGLFIAKSPAMGLVAALSVASVGIALTKHRLWYMVPAVLAVPPGLLSGLLRAAGLSRVFTIGVVGLGLGAWLLRRPRTSSFPVRVAMLSYLVMMAVMIVSAFAFGTWRIEGVAGQFLNFVYYAGTFALAVGAAPSAAAMRAQYVRAVVIAVAVSAIGTGLIGVAQTGTVLVPDFRLLPADVGLMYHRTHFGYLMALGFVAAAVLSRLSDAEASSVAWVVLTGLAAYLVIFSMTRGAWLAVLGFLGAVAVHDRRPGLVAAVVPALGLLHVSPIRQRLVGEFSGGVAAAVQSGAAGSYRIALWETVWQIAAGSIIFGKGFGFLRSVVPSAYFGEGQMVTPGNPVLYAHNDILFLVLETGLIGAGAYVITWAGMAYGLYRSLRSGDASGAEHTATAALAGAGILIVLAIAQFVDNAFFIRSVFERCVVGVAVALVAAGAFEYRNDRGAAEEPVNGVST